MTKIVVELATIQVNPLKSTIHLIGATSATTSWDILQALDINVLKIGHFGLNLVTLGLAHNNILSNLVQREEK